MSDDFSMEALHRSEPFQWWARFGYAARGVLYGIVGGLAALAALDQSGAPRGSRGALQSLFDEPFGRVLLGVIAASLLGYSAWRFVQAIRDVDHHGRGVRGLVIRGGFVISGLVYAGLALFALRLMLFGPSGQATQHWLARLLAAPFGPWLAGLIGVAIAGAGLGYVWRGWRRRYRRFLHASARRMRWVDPISRCGLMARGVVFVLVGGFFIAAAYQVDASEARGVAGVLRTLENQLFGTWLLLAAALGLIAFALYSFVEALYRHIE